MRKIISIIIGFTLTLLMVGGYAWAGKPTVGMVLVGPKADGGWSMRHYQGIKETGYEFGLVEVVPEADSERVFGSLARKYDVIIGTSFGYMEAMLRVAKKFPDKTFLHATGYKTAKNLDNYNCRLFQARYLAGVAAGMLSKTNKIGFVGSHPIPEIISNINAATLGARSVNPKVTVEIIWINSWFDPGKDKDAANALFENGADVLFTTTDSPSVVILAQNKSTSAKPLWGMGNDAPMNSYGPDRYATGPMFNWSVLYSHYLEKVSSGNFEVERPFWGLKSGCVTLSPWGSNVPAKVVNYVEAEKAKFVSEQYDAQFPFSSGFKTQSGKNQTINERLGIDTMSFFVDGISSKFPVQ